MTKGLGERLRADGLGHAELTADSVVRAAVSGNENALERALTLACPGLQHTLAGRIGETYRSAVSEEDVIQITFIEAFLRIRTCSFETFASFNGWLRVMAQNNLRDAIRELDRKKRPPRRRQIQNSSEDGRAESLLARLICPGKSPSRHARRQEANARLHDLLKELPEDYRKVIRLYDLEERPIEEVAEALNRSPGAVHMAKKRAHDRLRELLGDPGGFLSSRS